MISLMAEAIFVSGRVRVPAAALTVRAVRSSGPGGQNVNKVASKIELRVDLQRIEGLDEASRARLEAATALRRDAEGRLLVTSQRTRDQGRNLEDAREKVFRRFHSERPDAEDFGNHSGLGLAIARTIAEAHDGTLVALPRDDGAAGACMLLTLPQRTGARP